MPLRETIAALVATCPPDATVPVRWLGELLEGEATPEAPRADIGIVDLTVAQVAERFGKGQSTVRTWLERGELPGAYKSHGREWRIPVSAIAAMQRAQARQHDAPSTEKRTARRGAVPDLGAWRKHTGTNG